MIDIKDRYDYEIELNDGTILTKTDNFDPNKVVRISYIPSIKLFPQHDIVFSGFKYIRRFSRAFMGWNSIVKEYLHCVVTDKFRIYLFSKSGKILITGKDYELYL